MRLLVKKITSFSKFSFLSLSVKSKYLQEAVRQTNQIVPMQLVDRKTKSQHFVRPERHARQSIVYERIRHAHIASN